MLAARALTLAGRFAGLAPTASSATTVVCIADIAGTVIVRIFLFSVADGWAVVLSVGYSVAVYVGDAGVADFIAVFVWLTRVVPGLAGMGSVAGFFAVAELPIIAIPVVDAFPAIGLS